jgi:hypothetical protein
MEVAHRLSHIDHFEPASQRIDADPFYSTPPNVFIPQQEFHTRKLEHGTHIKQSEMAIQRWSALTI